jgi:DNA-directed RNA polymerase subunit RPC12/RpoP
MDGLIMSNNIIENPDKVIRTYNTVIPQLHKYEDKIKKLDSEYKEFINKHLDRRFYYVCKNCGRGDYFNLRERITNYKNSECRKCGHLIFNDGMPVIDMHKVEYLLQTFFVFAIVDDKSIKLKHRTSSYTNNGFNEVAVFQAKVKLSNDIMFTINFDYDITNETLTLK